jgi:hypothetical protein
VETRADEGVPPRPVVIRFRYSALGDTTIRGNTGARQKPRARRFAPTNRIGAMHARERRGAILNWIPPRVARRKPMAFHSTFRTIPPRDNPMTEIQNTLQLLKAHAHELAIGGCESMPAGLISCLMMANNRILTAAIIENGGKLKISAESVRAMFRTSQHVVAAAHDDDSVMLSLAPKAEVIANSDLMAL